MGPPVFTSNSTLQPSPYQGTTIGRALPCGSGSATIHPSRTHQYKTTTTTTTTTTKDSPLSSRRCLRQSSHASAWRKRQAPAVGPWACACGGSRKRHGRPWRTSGPATPPAWGSCRERYRWHAWPPSHSPRWICLEHGHRERRWGVRTRVSLAANGLASLQEELVTAGPIDS